MFIALHQGNVIYKQRYIILQSIGKPIERKLNYGHRSTHTLHTHTQTHIRLEYCKIHDRNDVKRREHIGYLLCDARKLQGRH